MTGPIQCDLEVKERLAGRSDFSGERAAIQAPRQVRFMTLSARAVELIAKPGKSRQLRACLRQEVLNYLRKRSGFAGTFVLTSHKEPRLNLVLSFWRTEAEACADQWEDCVPVRRLVSSLADVCKKVQTYEATLPDTLETPFQSISTFNRRTY